MGCKWVGLAWNGVSTALAGLRDICADDDQLLAAAGAVFDSLLVTFEKGVACS
ncbi:MAG: hypothetical protein ACXWTH_07630 [Methylosarcina sp.]